MECDSHGATNVSLFKSAVKRHYVILAHEPEESDY